MPAMIAAMPEGSVTVITGGSAGIGAATARLLARQDHSLVLAARSAGNLAALAEELGSRVRTVVADVTKRGDVDRIRDEALAAFGRIDVWINNAGRGITRPVLELSDEDIDEMVAVNIR